MIGAGEYQIGFIMSSEWFEIDTTHPQAERVSRLLCEVWEIITSKTFAEFAEVMLNYWQKNESEEFSGRLQITFIDIDDLGAAACRDYGCEIRFSEDFLDQYDDTRVRNAIAEELAHCFQWSRDIDLRPLCFFDLTRDESIKLYAEYHPCIDAGDIEDATDMFEAAEYFGRNPLAQVVRWHCPVENDAKKIVEAWGFEYYDELIPIR